MARVRISKIPKALSGFEVKMRPGLYGTNGNRQFTLPNQVNSQRFAERPVDVRDTLKPVAREGANLEAEKGETALVNINGIPAHFKIGGQRHSKGGTPLNLPDNSFIFSDTAKMKIKDPMVHAQFGMVPKKSGYTPAEIAKKYDINTFRKILADPNSEDVERKTAEMMITNYNMKLAKLALVQESMKGFPQGIPAVAMPYLIANDINPAELAETQGQEEQPDADMGVSRYGGNMISQFPTKAYGGVQYNKDGLPMGQDGFWSNVGQGVLNVLEAPQKSMMYIGTGIAGELQGKGWTGQYEMPSETIRRNFPGHPFLEGAADLLADPLLIAGAVKGIARSGLKKVLAKETADLVTTGATKKLTGYEVTRAALRNAAAKSKDVLKGKKTIDEVAKSYETAKNLERINAAIKASEKIAASKRFTKAADLAKQSKMVQNAAIKAVGNVAQKQTASAIGKGTLTAAKLPLKGAVAAGKYIAENAPIIGDAAKYVGQKAVDVAQNIGSANISPLLLPGTKIIGEAGSRLRANQAIEKAENETAAVKKELSLLKAKPKTSKTPKDEPSYQFTPAGKSPSGVGLFTTNDPKRPGPHMFYKGSFVPYTPPGGNSPSGGEGVKQGSYREQQPTSETSKQFEERVGKKTSSSRELNFD